MSTHMWVAIPRGTNPLLGALEGAEIGSVGGPIGTVAGGLIGAGIGAYLGSNVLGPILAEDTGINRGAKNSQAFMK